jgi:hypothetical protein
MTKDEALKKAFKQAFQLGQDYWYQADHEFESQNKKSDVTREKFEQLMEDAIKEALAQPERTPYITMPPSTPMWTIPPQRKPLTEQKIGAILEDTNAFGTRLYTFARAIEAAHGIKGEA